VPGSIAILVAAHGAARGNEPIERVARALARRRPEARVVTGYHKGSPSFSEAMEGVDADHVAVVPFFTSDGHYVRTVLPRELARVRPLDATVTIAPPIGIHPAVPALVAGELRRHFAERLARPDAEVVVVGHGTEKNASSGEAAIALAAALLRLGVARKSSAVFLDQEPRLERLAEQPHGGPRIVFPFLIGGSHLEVDLPARLGLNGRSDSAEVLIAEPFGSLPGIVDLVDRSFLETLRRAA
jgi:sirohydrochlorin cobaltochelatase